jgi:probable phosphoglycerate mutase
MRSTLESAADEFRGETVLVVSHAGAIRVTLPRLADNVPDDFGTHIPLGDCATSEIAVDADGWVLRSWCGRPVSTNDAG